jgi:hypothetical protein
MKIYRFGPQVGRQISHFDSNFIMSPIVRISGGKAEGEEPAGWHNASEGTRIGAMHIPAGGVVGYHQATVPQLFLVVAGEGWVRGAAPEHTPIRRGYAAFWEAGEWHEAGSDEGMSSIVIEGETVNPAQFMPEATT